MASPPIYSPPPLACSVEGCDWTTPPNVPTWELIATLMGQHTQAAHQAGGQGGKQEKLARPTLDTGNTGENIMEIKDRSLVEKIKLTRYGFKWNLIGFSSFLSILGIVVSTLGTIGAIATLAIGIWFSTTRTFQEVGPWLIIIGILIFAIMILYLAMWIALKKKTNKRNIMSIERIGKIYSYLRGALEIIAMASCLLSLVFHFSYHGPNGSFEFGFSSNPGEEIFIFLFATTDLIFACLQIHAIMLEKNKLLGIYLGYRYAAFFLTIIAAFILAICDSESLGAWIGGLIGDILFFILDIGLTVILHSIRDTRRSFVGMENPLNDFEYVQ